MTDGTYMEVDSFVEEYLYYAKFDVLDEEERKIEDEDDFLIGIKFIYCMEHAENDANDEDEGNDNEMGHGTVYDMVSDGTQLWII